MATIDFASLPNKTFGTGLSTDLDGTEQIFINDSGNPKDITLDALAGYMNSSQNPIQTADTLEPGANNDRLATTAFVYAERSNPAVLTNKTINLANNTLITTSAQLQAAITDESGTGKIVFSASPSFTGIPIAPTAAAGVNNTQIATTAHVFAERTNTAALTNKTLTSPVINTPTGIMKADVGLSNVDNTADIAKPVSTAGFAELATKTGGGTLIIVTDTSYTAQPDYHMVLTNAGTTTVGLSLSPVFGETVRITVANGLNTNIVNPNGKKIMGIVDNMIIDFPNSAMMLRYVSEDFGWAIL